MSRCGFKVNSRKAGKNPIFIFSGMQHTFPSCSCHSKPDYLSSVERKRILLLLRKKRDLFIYCQYSEFQLDPIDFYCMGKKQLKHFSKCHGRKKVMQVWDDMVVSVHFWVNYAFKYMYYCGMTLVKRRNFS